MEFHVHNTQFRLNKFNKNLTLEEKAKRIYSTGVSLGGNPDAVREQVQKEFMWEKYGRPYYNIWPSIIPLLLKINLEDIPISSLDPPYPSLQLRFKKGDEWLGIHNILITRYSFEGEEGIGIDWLWGDISYNFCQAIQYVNILKSGVKTVREGLDLCLEKVKNYPLIGQKEIHTRNWTIEEIENVIKLSSTILMIGNDPNILENDLLKKDENRNEIPLVDRVKRAVKRKHGIGFHVGRKYERIKEIAPYVVPPHPQRYWIGKGRKKCVILTRSSYVANKKKVTAVPTGFDLQEGQKK